MKIVWTKRASQKLDQIISCLLAEWGEKSAIEFIGKVFDFLDILIEYPEIGFFENKEKNIRGFTIVKQVNVFYRIKEDHIIILLLFDNRQNPKKKRF